MENRIKQVSKTTALIRYADDFVIIHEDLTVVQRCQQVITEWLKGMGLELKPSKTRLTHTLHKYEENVGFNFLGFNVRQHKVGTYRSARNGKKQPLGFNTLITPSKEKIKLHLEETGGIIDTHITAPQAALIKALNPVIRGWANYYSTVVSNDTFQLLNHLTYQKLRAWAIRRCPRSNQHEIVNKYWHTVGNDNWVFSTQDGLKLARHTDTPIVRHVKVQGERSPYDGDWIYWSTRLGKHPEATNRVAKLLKRQKGKCEYCGLYFKDGDLMEIDHKIPMSKGGKDTFDNLQIIHRHCHDNKTALDGSNIHTVGSNESTRGRLP